MRSTGAYTLSIQTFVFQVICDSTNQLKTWWVSLPKDRQQSRNLCLSRSSLSSEEDHYSRTYMRWAYICWIGNRENRYRENTIQVQAWPAQPNTGVVFFLVHLLWIYMYMSLEDISNYWGHRLHLPPRRILWSPIVLNQYRPNLLLISLASFLGIVQLNLKA